MKTLIHEVKDVLSFFCKFKKPISCSITASMIAIAFAQAAPPPDGFVITEFGKWDLEKGVLMLSRAQQAGARHVSLIAHLCQDSAFGSSMYWCESDGEPFKDSFQGVRMARMAEEIKNRGMSFSVIPMILPLDIKNRQLISPADHAEWFKNYGDKVEELSSFIADLGASEFVVGSELTSLFADEAGWRGVIARVRGVFRGHLTVSPVAWQYALIRFWDALDSIGVSAYFPLSIGSNDPSVVEDPLFIKVFGIWPALTDFFSRDWSNSFDSYSSAWEFHKMHLIRFAQSQGNKRITFIEVGYPTVANAAQKPWDYSWDQDAQAEDTVTPGLCWQAYQKAWAGEPMLRAFRIWGLNPSLDLNKNGFSPIGRPYAGVIRSLFKDRAAIYQIQ